MPNIVSNSHGFQKLWDSAKLSDALKADVNPGIEANGVSIDSRTIMPGEIFVAIKGEKYDGNTFAISALEKGAALAIVSDWNYKSSIYNAQVIVVEDTLKALEKLAIHARSHIRGKLIGVTGSVGKTTTKEMLRLALDGQGNCYASKGNFNNYYGLPLCLANMPENTDYAILEMGMSSAGELRHLSQLAKPDIAIITTVEAAHLEFFSSVAGIAAAKAEIFEGTSAEGTAIINFDNPYHQILLNSAHHKKLKILGFGLSRKANFKLEKYEVRTGKSFVTAECMGKDISYTIGAVGKHIVMNSLTALAAVYAVGAEVPYAAKCLAKFSAPKGRGQIHKIASGKIILIDDSYNASPASIKAALALLAAHRSNGNRLIAVLGSMMELGAYEKDLHQDLLADVISNCIDRVYTVGDLMEHLYKVLPANVAGAHSKTSNDMVKIITQEIADGDVVLVKGSNSIKMANIIGTLLDLEKNFNRSSPRADIKKPS